MSSAIAGAMFPETVNEKWHEIVQTVNRNELLELGEKLYSIRCKK